MKARSIPRQLLGLLVPPRCLGCRRLLEGAPELGLCIDCRLGLMGEPPAAGARLAGVDEWLAATTYSGPARGIVAALKSGAAPAAAMTAAELIAEALAAPADDTVLVPVGGSLRRRLRRGLDPAEEIALALSERLGLRLERSLRRLDRRRQAGRPRELRLSDPPRFIACAPAPARVLLVDDVLTTGGTLSSCARALRGAGSAAVAAVAFARTPPPV